MAQWATYSPGRRPAFKVHSKRGFALNAFMKHGAALLFENLDGRWIERLRYNPRDPEPRQCMRCFQWDAPATSAGTRGVWSFGRLPNGKIDYDDLRLEWKHVFDHYGTRDCRR